MKVFLDLDGVLCYFLKGVEEKFNVDLSDHIEWNFDYQKDFGISKTKFWKSLDHDFWANLPKTPECDLILALVEGYKPIILTAPPLDESGGCVSGKVEWIRKNLPEFFFEGRYLIGAAKESISRPGALLIDDNERTITEWQSEGGTGILVPRPWNSLGQIGAPVIETIQQQLIICLGDEY